MKQNCNQFVESRKPSLFTGLVEQGKIDNDLKAQIEAVLKEFTEQFTASRTAAA